MKILVSAAYVLILLMFVSCGTDIVSQETNILDTKPIIDTPLVGSETSFFVDDRDGNHYTTKVYGRQTWMTTNLRYDTLGAIAIDSMKQIYGNYYNWEDACKVCPNGWHLPTDEEWMIFEKFLGLADSELDRKGNRGEGIGLIMRSDHGWKFDNNGTNTTKFNAPPAGICLPRFKEFSLQEQEATYWTSTEKNDDQAVLRTLNHYDTKITRNYSEKKFMYSVRCIKDN